MTYLLIYNFIYSWNIETHIYWRYSINEGTEHLYKALLLNDYKLTLRLKNVCLRVLKKKPKTY